MEQSRVIRLISQYLYEHDFKDSLKELEKESGRIFSSDAANQKSGELQAILDEFSLREKQRLQAGLSVEHQFKPGNNEYADKLWCSFDGLCYGENILVVNLTENGVMAFGGAKAQLGTLELPLPLSETPPTMPIPTSYSISKGSILCIDFHPQRRNILLCGSMDRSAYILDVEMEQDGLLQSFSDHSKYVVHTLWAPSGRFFVTGSYDHSFCIYRISSESDKFELVEKVEVNGTVEGLAFHKDSDEFIVGIRGDHLLHCYNLSSGRPIEVRRINMNMFGDDFVSFVPMHISFSPNGHFFLVSSDRDKLILFSWDNGKPIANFYGATNDELSQPRHCWDSSGKYIYGTSQDYSICVWEIRNQKLVARLTGHTGTVRNLHFCEKLGILVSCGFDGTIKFWKKTSQQEVHN